MCKHRHLCDEFLYRYSVVGWSLPWLPVVIALVIDGVEPEAEFAPQYGLPQCWLNSPYGVYIYFLIPLTCMFVANFVTYILVVIRFSILAFQSRGVRKAHHEKIILSVKLFFAFGLLWIFGLLSAIFPGNAAFACIFIFTSSLNGLMLFLVFLCNEAVFKALKKFKSETSHSSSKPTNQTSQHSNTSGNTNQS